MSNILNFLKSLYLPERICNLLYKIVFIIITGPIQCRIHEYGHVLKLKKEIYKDINNYKEETNSNIINIKIAKFECDYKIKEHIDYKIKTYSDYFIYLQNKKQEFKYQNIIKDIAINGYQFNKQAIMYICIPLLILYCLILVALLMPNMLIVSLIPNILGIGSIVCICIAIIVFLYLFLSINGYGLNKIKSEITMSDKYIHSHPNEFRYITLEKDAELLQRNYKILLEIEIDLANSEDPKINIISKDLIYKWLTQKFSLDN